MTGHPTQKFSLDLQGNLMFICKQKIKFRPPFFLEILQTCHSGYFWHAWLWSTNTMVSDCRKLDVIVIQKIKFIIHVIFEILLWYCKPAILGTPGMHQQSQWKQQYQLKGNFYLYLNAKNQFDSWFFSWDITLQGILQSDYLRPFWFITWESEFCPIRGLWWSINNIWFFILDHFQ